MEKQTNVTALQIQWHLIQTHTPGMMLGHTPLLPLALPRPVRPDRPAPLGLLLPGKAEPRPCGCKLTMRKCVWSQVRWGYGPHLDGKISLFEPSIHCLLLLLFRATAGAGVYYRLIWGVTPTEPCAGCQSISRKLWSLQSARTDSMPAVHFLATIVKIKGDDPFQSLKGHAEFIKEYIQWSKNASTISGLNILGQLIKNFVCWNW